MATSFQRYERPGAHGALPAPASVFGDGDRWIVLRRAEGPRLPSIRCVDIARTARRALMKAHGDGAPEIISGHRLTGEAADRPHLAYVPLPFVGNEHADGHVMGVALVLPRAAAPEDRAAVFRALHRWAAAARRDDDDDDDDRALLPVHLGRSGELVLERLDEEAIPYTLRPRTWCAEATEWATATPIALDRNPGDFYATDAKKEAAAYAKAAATVALACERIGLPRPARVTVVQAAPIAGATKARLFPPFKAGDIQRVLVHATLAFHTRVRGPILLGAGRYFGLGLCRPLAER